MDNGALGKVQLCGKPRRSLNAQLSQHFIDLDSFLLYIRTHFTYVILR